jgi:hypothetical protein
MHASAAVSIRAVCEQHSLEDFLVTAAQRRGARRQRRSVSELTGITYVREQAEERAPLCVEDSVGKGVEHVWWRVRQESRQQPDIGAQADNRTDMGRDPVAKVPNGGLQVDPLHHCSRHAGGQHRDQQ